MAVEWSQDGVRLSLTSRRAAPARRAARIAHGVALGAGGMLVLALWLVPPEPPCATGRCEALRPVEVNPSPPALDTWVSRRAEGILDEIRTLDRLPADVDAVGVVDGLDDHGFAFLAAEHQNVRVVVGETEAASGLRSALERYRQASGEGRVHFRDATRFLAEIAAVRAAVDRAEARAELDALVESGKSVLDLGTAPLDEVRAEAEALAEREWRTRRELERRVWADLRARVRQRHAEDRVAWLFGVVSAATALAIALLLAGRLRARARALAEPVEIELSSRTVRLGPRRVPREAVRWMGMRSASVLVELPEGEWVSEPVVEAETLTGAVRWFNALAEVGGDEAPEDAARVRALTRKS